jgi:hypothetical protein
MARSFDNVPRWWRLPRALEEGESAGRALAVLACDPGWYPERPGALNDLRLVGPELRRVRGHLGRRCQSGADPHSPAANGNAGAPHGYPNTAEHADPTADVHADSTNEYGPADRDTP